MRFNLSDEEWTLLEPLMPASRKSARADDRRIMNSIFYVLRTGDAMARFAGALWPLHDGLAVHRDAGMAARTPIQLRQSGIA
ncbi:MAG TPA: transposase [Rhizomicrobium sp.]